MAKMRISPELKKLIEKYRCVKDTEGMSPAKVYKLVGENENLYLKMTDSRYKGTTYDVEREKDMMLWLEGKLPVPKVLHFERHDGWKLLWRSRRSIMRNQCKLTRCCLNCRTETVWKRWACFIKRAGTPFAFHLKAVAASVVSFAQQGLWDYAET